MLAVLVIELPAPRMSNNTNVLTVSSINELIRVHLQKHPPLSEVWLEGEVSNYKQQNSSGHIYFSLKDSSSQINCTFFRGKNLGYQHLKIQDGVKVLVFGSITVYKPRGNYQFNIERAMLSGEGELRRKLEELQKKLQQEGLFDPVNKKPLPLLPITLGVATAASGAAIRDIMQHALARYPNLNITLVSCLVQGPEAPASIIHALQLLQEPERKVDVIIVGRGGGSFEDLLAFSEENVVRAIAACRLPIVSAVGHEIDSSLSDYAADSSAPTPTGAAVMVTPVIGELSNRITENQIRMQVKLEDMYKQNYERLIQICNSPVYKEPLAILNNYWQRLDELKKNIQQASLATQQRAWRSYERLAYLPQLLYEKNLSRLKQQHELLNERLQNFSPLATLKRGYAVARNKSKEIIRSPKDVAIGEKLQIILDKGQLDVEVKHQSYAKLK